MPNVGVGATHGAVLRILDAPVDAGGFALPNECGDGLEVSGDGDAERVFDADGTGLGLSGWARARGVGAPVESVGAEVLALVPDEREACRALDALALLNLGVPQVARRTDFEYTLTALEDVADGARDALIGDRGAAIRARSRVAAVVGDDAGCGIART